MRVGIACEGPTDALAIEHFVRESMLARGTSVEFVRLRPESDQTQGGWSNMLLWLQDNPPQSRVSAYFGGLFQDDMGAKQCDAIVLQLDADILAFGDVRESLKARFGVAAEDSPSPQVRGQQISHVIKVVGKFHELAMADLERHVAAPAVEATETWCVGVFRRSQADDLENVRGSALRQEFMSALHRSEGRQDAGPYSQTDKSMNRRQRFCKRHAAGYARLEDQCPHYRSLVDKLADLAV